MVREWFLRNGPSVEVSRTPIPLYDFVSDVFGQFKGHVFLEHAKWYIEGFSVVTAGVFDL